MDGIPELGPEMAHLDEQLLPAEDLLRPCGLKTPKAVSALTSLSLTLPIDGMRLLDELRPLPIFCYEARWTMTWSPITVALPVMQGCRPSW